MDAKTLSSDDLLKIVGSLVTSLVGLFAVVDRFRKQLSRIKTVYVQIGSLGWPYTLLVSLPARVLWWSLVLVSLTSACVMVQGLFLYANKPLPFGLRSRLGFAYPLVGIAILLLLFSYLEIWTRVGVFVLRRFGKLRFHPGCINAGWQVEEPEVKAMNVSSTHCEALGIAILDCLSGQNKPPGEMAPALPAGTDRSLIANYVFFGCVIEHFVHGLALPPESLNLMWRYMAWAATTTEQPLDPSRLVSSGAVQHGRYFETLQEVGNAHSGKHPGVLPVSPQIADAVNQAATWLVFNYAGNARDLSKSVLRSSSSPNVVWDNLSGVEPFHSSDALRSLFLKLAMRMQVWPEMKPGAFLFPYYAGLPVLFLNGGCLVVAQDMQRIDPDEGWRALVAATEEKIIEAAYRQLQLQSSEQPVIDLSHRFFGSDPRTVDKWSFIDFIDLWLFDQTRNQCRKQSVAEDPKSCTLRGGADECFCVRHPRRWYRDGVSFLRRA